MIVIVVVVTLLAFPALENEYVDTLFNITPLFSLNLQKNILLALNVCPVYKKNLSPFSCLFKFCTINASPIREYDDKSIVLYPFTYLKVRNEYLLLFYRKKIQVCIISHWVQTKNSKWQTFKFPLLSIHFIGSSCKKKSFLFW